MQPKSYADLFEEAFPYYLAMGMTYEQFWEQDSDIVKYYRKAQEIRREEQNRQAWLQGMYVYEAIADIAPILHAFAKRGTKARPYSTKPYEFKAPEPKKGEAKLSALDREAKAKTDKIRAKMIASMNKTNAAFAKQRIEAQQQKQQEAGKALMEGEPTGTKPDAV